MEEKGIMRTVTLEELLEAGCHFGHQVTRQNPKARDYIFEARDNIHIIDLAKTKEGLEESAAFVKDVARKGGTMLVLATKRQAESVIKEELDRAFQSGSTGLYSVTKRWIGGTLTNFQEVSKNYKKLKTLTDQLKDKRAQEGYTKKEVGQWEKERQKLSVYYGGVENLTHIPDVLFIIDTHLEDLAVREAHEMGATVVGITDTNADPTIVDYPIPANDDAVGSIKIIAAYIIDAWIEGKEAMKVQSEKAAADAQKEAEKTASDEKKKAEKASLDAKNAETKPAKEVKTAETKAEKVETKPAAKKAAK